MCLLKQADLSRIITIQLTKGYTIPVNGKNESFFKLYICHFPEHKSDLFHVVVWFTHILYHLCSILSSLICYLIFWYKSPHLLQYHTSLPERKGGRVTCKFHSGYCLKIIAVLSTVYATKEI